MRIAIAALVLAGCYTGAPANRDVAASWRGRSAAELEDRWGPPAGRDEGVLGYAYHRTHIELPSAEVEVRPVTATAAVATPAGGALVRTRALAVRTAVHPGAIFTTTTEAAAFVENGAITHVEGAALHWGPPNDENLHWGTILGGHVGMGRLDSTSTPLPSGGLYIGGMLGPAFGLVGTFDMVSGSAPAGAAMGFAWGMAAQWWPVNRLALHGGPAMILAFDPGFTNAGLQPGVTAGASYAFVKVGKLALDLRLDVDAGPSVSFGTVGVGVNMN